MCIRDSKGIELKSKRSTKKARGNRSTLFSQVPDWSRSGVGNPRALLEAYGYRRDGEPNLRLYNTVNASAGNSQGHQLRLSSGVGKLEIVDTSSKAGLVYWALEKLHLRLLEKHAETFWVEAESKLVDGIEHFRYHSAIHSRRPQPSNFDALLEAGVITLDLTLKEMPTRIRDHGYLFKLPPKQLSALFPQQIPYSLERTGIA